MGDISVSDIKIEARNEIVAYYTSFDIEHRKHFVKLAEAHYPDRFKTCELLKKKLDQETDPFEAHSIAKDWVKESIELIRHVMIRHVIKVC